MGRMVDGTWTTQWYEPDEDGRFKRPETRFRSQVSAEPGAEFAPEAGRYHLVVSYACPWAHRTLIARALNGLEEAISVTVVEPKMGAEGWTFGPEGEGAPPVAGLSKMYELYRHAASDYTGRVTVPVLWDLQRQTIVNNESREILRMMNTVLRPLATRDPGLCPPGREAELDELIDAIYEPINNGVYRAGFATTQKAYEEAVVELFDALERWEGVLSKQRFLTGECLSEADICLFTTLARFDLVYHGHFKCNLKRIADFPALSGFLRDVVQTPGVRETTRLDHIKRHYYWSHETINPHRIVPLGPVVDLETPHGRAGLGRQGGEKG